MLTQTQSILCASCGAGINVPPDLDRLSCAHCGTPLTIVRGEGYIAAKLADRVTEAITASGVATQAELHRIQLRQEAVSLESQLSSLETEGRALRRGEKTHVVWSQLHRLETCYNGLVDRLHEVQDELGIPQTHIKFDHSPPKASTPWPMWAQLLAVSMVSLLVIGVLWASLGG